MNLENMADVPDNKPTPPRAFLKECAVAGVSFHIKYQDELWDELEEGTEVALVHEKRNKYDRNAVAVALASDYDGDPDNFDFRYILGYVPRTENSDIAEMLDNGTRLYAELSQVRRHCSLNDRLRISIYLEGADADEPPAEPADEPMLRGHLFDDESFRSFTSQLMLQGYYYMRLVSWPHNSNLPEKNDRIVAAYRSDGICYLYLLKVLARGNDCAAFVDEEVDLDDDCVGYVFGNIAGPIDASRLPLGFLVANVSDSFSLYRHLSSELSDGFLNYFKSLTDRQ